MAVVNVLSVLGYLITVLSYFANSHNVPVFIWGSKSHSNLPALSALSHVSSEQFSKDYLKQLINHKTLVIVFIQDRLSLEDLSVHGNGLTPEGQNFVFLQNHLDGNPSLILRSVEDPFQVLRDVKGHQVIETLNYNDDMHRRMSAVRGDLTLIYLPATVGIGNRPEGLKANDELMNKALSHLGTKNYIAIFTGKEPSWDAASEEASIQRISRSLLQSSNAEAGANPNFLARPSANVYAENGSLIVEPFNSTVDWPPAEFTATNDSNTTVVLDMKFSQPEFQLSLTLEKFEDFGFWNYTNISLTYQDETYSLKSNRPIVASIGFSFSCGNIIFKQQNNSLPIVSLTLTKFQVEPFPASNSSFSDSFHCSTWFTLPIWMGFFTILLFTVILGFAIFMLFQVKTMDRFDDPKGKTITVPLSE